ncbi:2-Methylisocitrate lyase, PEP mutase family [Enhydrobacter aerosaccus]|uniref:2-Methylisocitrate lyase, PEP mutase family n=1 Tax=Enhydrobacter aerosaccus TaxID=225324 RepID=A0A1T4K763_9HYPH|nr:isocitrate lyase/PEP mutase family protein [Enhydrobacter aerosaccus]SJZ38290.1 2-Methylisocitrate lyase, PEP mutase family [Enhydrobacter aerosaccus]
MKAAHRLRTKLSEGGLLTAPGAYDGITARLSAQAGFDAVYMTGAGVSAAHGFPDYGLLTLSEMAAAAGILARSVDVPVIADADTGYGNELNATRTVREYEMRGIAAIQIEDQVAPKRCGHLDGKEIVPREEFAAKIAAAAAARCDHAFVLIARTDARAMDGLDEAVVRVNMALDAGADIAFIEAPRSVDEIAAIPRFVHGPCLLNVVSGGKTPDMPLKAIAEMGYRIAILPGLLLTAVLDACDAALADLRSSGAAPAGAAGRTIGERFRRLGAEEWDALRRQAPRAAA